LEKKGRDVFELRSTIPRNELIDSIHK